MNGNTYQVDPNGLLYVEGGGAGGFETNNAPKISADVHTSLGAGSLIVRGYAQGISLLDSFEQTSTPFEELTRDHLEGLLALWTVALRKHTLTLSAGANGDSFTFGCCTGTFQQLTYSFSGTQIEREYLLRDDIQSSAKLNLTFAGYYSSYDTLNVKRFDPRLAVVYRPNSSSMLRASLATGFAAPRLGDLTPLNPVNYLQTGGFAVPGGLCPSSEPGCSIFSGNPSLKPESAIGIDLGYQHLLGEKGQIGVDLYRTNLRDHIYGGTVAAPPGLTFGKVLNPDFGCGCEGKPVLFIQQPTNLVGTIYTGAEMTASLPFGSNFILDGSYNIQIAYPISVDVPTLKFDINLLSIIDSSSTCHRINKARPLGTKTPELALTSDGPSLVRITLTTWCLFQFFEPVLVCLSVSTCSILRMRTSTTRTHHYFPQLLVAESPIEAILVLTPRPRSTIPPIELRLPLSIVGERCAIMQVRKAT